MSSLPIANCKLQIANHPAADPAYLSTSHNTMPTRSPLDTQVLDASIEFGLQPFHKPLQISKGLIREVTDARATVTVRTGGRTAVGRGSIPLSDVWAWPDPALTHDQRDAAMRQYCQAIASSLSDLCGSEPAH